MWWPLDQLFQSRRFLNIWGNQWNRSHILELEQWPSKAIIGSTHCPRSVCSWLLLPIKMSQLSVTDLGFRSPKLAGPVDKRNNYEQRGKKTCLSQPRAGSARRTCHSDLNQVKSGTVDTFSPNWPWKCKSLKFTQCYRLLWFELSSKETGCLEVTVFFE